MSRSYKGNKETWLKRESDEQEPDATWHMAKSVARRTERRKDKRLKSTATQ